MFLLWISNRKKHAPHPELTMLFGCDLKAYTELNMSHDRMSVKSPNHTRPSPLSVPSLTKTVLVDVSYFKG